MRDLRGRLNMHEYTHHDRCRGMCRNRVHAHAPYLNNGSAVNLGTLLLICGNFKYNLTTGQISQNRGVRQGSVTKMLHMLGNAAYHSDFDFSRDSRTSTFQDFK